MNPCTRSGSRRRVAATPASRGAGVLLALVAQRVEARGDTCAGAQPGEVGGEDRRRARVGAVVGGGEVVVAKPVHLLAGEEEALGEESYDGRLAE